VPTHGALRRQTILKKDLGIKRVTVPGNGSNIDGTDKFTEIFL